MRKNIVWATANFRNDYESLQEALKTLEDREFAVTTTTASSPKTLLESLDLARAKQCLLLVNVDGYCGLFGCEAMWDCLREDLLEPLHKAGMIIVVVTAGVRLPKGSLIDGQIFVTDPMEIVLANIKDLAR